MIGVTDCMGEKLPPLGAGLQSLIELSSAKPRTALACESKCDTAALLVCARRPLTAGFARRMEEDGDRQRYTTQQHTSSCCHALTPREWPSRANSVTCACQRLGSASC